MTDTEAQAWAILAGVEAALPVGEAHDLHARIAAALTAAAERERALREALHTAGRCIKELDGYGKPRPSSPSVETVLGTIRAALEAK